MASPETSRSAKIRARLNHPIIDTDGHTVELMRVYLDYVKQIGGADMVKRYQAATNARGNNRVAAMGARLGAMMSSDIGHWDVNDMTEVVEEAYELVEDGLINEDDFRDFTFTNAVRLYAAMNPDFFKGTACEAAVDRLLSEGFLSRENGSGSQQSREQRIAD